MVFRWRDHNSRFRRHYRHSTVLLINTMKINNSAQSNKHIKVKALKTSRLDNGTQCCGKYPTIDFKYTINAETNMEQSQIWSTTYTVKCGWRAGRKILKVVKKYNALSAFRTGFNEVAFTVREDDNKKEGRDIQTLVTKWSQRNTHE
jgi:hypothetical protein